MRDVLGYAVAALIGLLTATLQPWSPQWWAGVIIASAIALITSLHILWNNLPVSARGAISRLFWKPTGYLRAWVGILLLCILTGGGYVGSHWPTTFLRSEQKTISGAAPIQTDAPVLSRLDHFILSCDIPQPVGETLQQSAEKLDAYEKNMEIAGDVAGIAYTFTPIRGGLRIEAEAVTEESKRRMLPLSSIGVTKLIIEVRRINQTEIVSVMVNLPPQFAIFGFIPPNPAAPDTIAARQWIEKQLLGVKDGTCHLV